METELRHTRFEGDDGASLHSGASEFLSGEGRRHVARCEGFLPSQTAGF